MKKMMIMAMALVMSLSVNAAKVAELTPFNGVTVNIPANVRVMRGAEYGMRVQADNAQLVHAIRTEVKDGVLVITARDINEARELQNVRITIFTPIDQFVSAGRDMMIGHVDVKDTNWQTSKSDEK